MEEGIWKLLHTIYVGSGMAGLAAFGILLLVFITIYETTRALITRFFSSSRHIGMFKKVNRRDLKNHAIFNRYAALIKYRVPQLHIKCPLRKRIFIKLLEIRLEAARDMIRIFVEHDLPKCSEAGLKDMLSTMMMASSVEWQTRAISAGIPMIAIDCFRDRNAVYADLVDKTVMDICGLITAYADINDKVDTILDIIGSMENSCLVAMEQTLDALNGELSKATFEGIKCMKCRPDCINIVKKETLG
jgi:hypothetical protein